jgi:hypothetical protein
MKAIAIAKQKGGFCIMECMTCLRSVQKAGYFSIPFTLAFNQV